MCSKKVKFATVIVIKICLYRPNPSAKDAKKLSKKKRMKNSLKFASIAQPIATLLGTKGESSRLFCMVRWHTEEMQGMRL